MFAATVVLTRLIAGDLPDRIGPLRCAAGAAAVESLGLALIALATSLPVAILRGGRDGHRVLAALSVAVAGGGEPAFPRRRRGAALGTFTGFFDLGVGLGAPLAGMAAALGGYSAAFWLASACALGTLAVALALRRGWSGSRAPAPIA